MVVVSTAAAVFRQRQREYRRAKYVRCWSAVGKSSIHFETVRTIARAFSSTCKFSSLWQNASGVSTQLRKLKNNEQVTFIRDTDFDLRQFILWTKANFKILFSYQNTETSSKHAVSNFCRKTNCQRATRVNSWRVFFLFYFRVYKL